jgi:hypothetical protein
MDNPDPEEGIGMNYPASWTDATGLYIKMRISPTCIGSPLPDTEWGRSPVGDEH